MNISLGEYLTERSRWERIVSDFKMPDTNGTIDNLEWFIENGALGNRFRPGFETALTIANDIISKVNCNEKTNLSGVHRKTV
jgi:hypothetical protein